MNSRTIFLDFFKELNLANGTNVSLKTICLCHYSVQWSLLLPYLRASFSHFQIIPIPHQLTLVCSIKTMHSVLKSIVCFYRSTSFSSVNFSLHVLKLQFGAHTMLVFLCSSWWIDSYYISPFENLQQCIT